MSTMEGGARSFSRRSFVKAAGAGALGLAGAGAMASTGAWLGPADAQDVADEHVAYTYHNEHCLCNCMLKCTVRDGRLCMIEPRPNEDKRFQNVCLKGISEIQHIYGEARLQSPMKRVGERGSGEFEVISWDEAFQTIAEAFKQCQDAYGKDALWIQYSTEAQQRFTPLLASLLGAQAGGMNGYDMGQGNGQGQAFGWDGMFAKNTIWEWPQAKTVLMVNCNVVETGMMWSRAFLDAMDAGTRIICFDPRFSATAAKASEWVPLNPGTDPALFLGFANHILENDLFDREHVLTNTALPFLVDAETGQSVGEPRTFVDPASGKESPSVHFLVWDTVSNSARPYDEAGVVPALEGEFTVDGRACTTQFTRLRAEMAEYTPEWAEGVTGVPAAYIARIAEEYAAGPSIICNGVGGIDKYGNNDVAGHAYALVASLTGNYGKRGTGCGIYCYHVTPYNATLGTWPLPEGAKTTPSTMGFYDIVQKPNNVHAAFFFGDIPTQKAANWNKTRAWLESLDFVALADIYHSSVADYVDLVLPVCSKFECADEVGGIKCANAHILENQKVIDPLFESKSDFYIEKGIAEAMGLGQYYPENGEEFARALLDSDDPLMAGITYERLAEEGGAVRLNGTESLLAPEVGMSYATPSGRQEPYYENLLAYGQAFPRWEEPQEAYAGNPLREKYPLSFIQSRSRFRVHSTYTGAAWIQQLFEPHIELNPTDAEARGLEDGAQVEVFNDRGSFTTALRLNESIQPGSAYMAESSYASALDGTMMQSVSNDTLNERGYALPYGPMIPYNDTLIEIKKAGE